jgi:hypothetical protein
MTTDPLVHSEKTKEIKQIKALLRVFPVIHRGHEVRLDPAKP